MRSSSGNGSGFSRSALTALKMAVLAPMPRASVMTAMMLKPGRLKRFLTAYRTSLKRLSMIGSFYCRLPTANFRFGNWHSEIGNGSGHTGDVNVDHTFVNLNSLLSNYREI